MRRLTCLLIVSIISLSTIQPVDACGDKTLRVRTGLRYYQSQAAKAPSAILIHSPALPPGKAAELRDFLNKVGHKATAIDDIGRVSNDLRDRKSTRLNSSHSQISYAVFCLKKKKKKKK